MNFRLVIILAIVFVRCDTRIKGQVRTDDQTICYQVFRNFPLLSEEGKLEKYDSTSMYIYLQNNYTVYQIPYIFTDLGRGLKEFKQTRMYHYFVQENKNNWGYAFNQRKPELAEHIVLDSALLRAGFSNFEIHTFFNDYETELLEKEEQKKHGKWTEKYNYVDKKSGKLLGNITLVFDTGFKKLSYSLSPEIDSLRNAKLFKFILETQKRDFPEHEISIDAFKRRIEIREVPVRNLDTVRTYIQRYKRQFTK